MKTFNLFVAVLVLVGCTKKLSYKEEAKFDEVSNSVVDESADYLYVASQANSSYSSQDSRPYFLGQEKLVRLRKTEKSVQVYEIEPDERFRGNLANGKLAFEIPVEHIEFECAKDRYGECRNEETKTSDVHWTQRRFIKPDFHNVKFTEPSVLPIEVEKLLGTNCHTEVSSRALGANWSGESLNFRIEKTFSFDDKKEGCSKIRKLSDATVTSVFHYSLVKRESLITPNYVPAVYEKVDENTFGFFSSRIEKAGVDFRNTLDSSKTLMNRWNPNRTEIVYYLSPEFNKPENKLLKQGTFAAIEKVNQGLKQSGAKFTIKINDTEQVQPGDISKSMIILVDDPAAASLLGYGPSIADPLTGEILSARTVMYAGTLRLQARAVYEDVRNKVREAAVSKAQADIDAKHKEFLDKQKKESETPVAAASLKNKDLLRGLNLHPSGKLATVPSLNKIIKNRNASGKLAGDLSDPRSILTNYTAHSDVKTMSPVEQKLKDMRQCLFTVDHLDFAKIVKNVLEVKKGHELAPWADLSDKQKEQMLDLIMPEIYLPVLIHEIGHNLGLRHNFAGSEDKENFYTQQELKAMGINQPVPHSTVMEYTASEFGSLPTLGKYDIAALKYAYGRKVDIIRRNKSGEVVKIETIRLQEEVEVPGKDNKPTKVTRDLSLGELSRRYDALNKKPEATEVLGIKRYRYCTDEHAGLNAGCKRFDEGTTYVEMAQNMIKNYHQMYALRNFRHDNLYFTVADDNAYINRVAGVFKGLRLFLEVYERLLPEYPKKEDWVKYTDLKDLKDATILTGQFFMDVLTTPTTSCLFKNKQDGTIEIESLGPDSGIASCFDLADDHGTHELIGEAGKHFHSRKDPKLRHAMANYSDQIDIRGIWMDKVLAAKMLLTRTLGSEKEPSSLDEGLSNYFLIEELQQPLIETLTAVMANSVERVLDVKTRNGLVLKIGAPVEMYDTQIIPTHLFPDRLKSIVLPVRNVRLQEVVLEEILNESEIAAKEKILDVVDRTQAFGIYKLDPVTAKLYSDDKIEVSNAVFIAREENTVAKNLIIDMNATRKRAQALSEILEAKKQGKPAPADVPENLKPIWNEEPEEVAARIGRIKAYGAKVEQVLEFLPKLNEKRVGKVVEVKLSDD